MLTLTPAAAEAVRTLISGTETGEEGGGLRISAGEPTSTGPSLELALVGGPEASDQAIEAHGAQLYLEPTVAELLDEKLLDASVESGRVRFALFDRRDSSGASPPT